MQWKSLNFLTFPDISNIFSQFLTFLRITLGTTSKSVEAQIPLKNEIFKDFWFEIDQKNPRKFQSLEWNLELAVKFWIPPDLECSPSSNII